jgi:NAD(P)H dehydrogenase (quinone)
MTNILILDGHPDPESLTSALVHAYANGARAVLADVRVLALRDLTFDLVLHRGFRVGQPLEADLETALAAIRDARHVVFAFPTWWAAPPALVKGFVDRLFLPGVAFEFERGKALPTGFFRGRSARLMTTMDSP